MSCCLIPGAGAQHTRREVGRWCVCGAKHEARGQREGRKEGELWAIPREGVGDAGWVGLRLPSWNGSGELGGLEAPWLSGVCPLEVTCAGEWWPTLQTPSKGGGWDNKPLWIGWFTFEKPVYLILGNSFRIRKAPDVEASEYKKEKTWRIHCPGAKGPHRGGPRGSPELPGYLRL